MYVWNPLSGKKPNDVTFIIWVNDQIVALSIYTDHLIKTAACQASFLRQSVYIESATI